MVLLSLILNQPVNRWANIIAAIIFFVFNLGLPTYPSAYDKFLIVVGPGFNALTVWYAWKWSKQETGIDIMVGSKIPRLPRSNPRHIRVHFIKGCQAFAADLCPDSVGL